MHACKDVQNYTHPSLKNKFHYLFSRYPIVNPREKCAGDLGDKPGVRSYGLRPAHERYDVYCYIDELKGRCQVVW